MTRRQSAIGTSQAVCDWLRRMNGSGPSCLEFVRLHSSFLCLWSERVHIFFYCTKTLVTVPLSEQQSWSVIGGDEQLTVCWRLQTKTKDKETIKSHKSVRTITRSIKCLLSSRRQRSTEAREDQKSIHLRARSKGGVTFMFHKITTVNLFSFSRDKIFHYLSHSNF